MNNTQRKFLVDQIRSKTDARIKSLEKELIPEPNLNAYIQMEIMTKTAKIKSSEEILENLSRRVKASLAGGMKWNHLDVSGWGSTRDENRVSFEMRDLFDVPAEYERQLAEYLERNAAIKAEIREIRESLEAIVTRITLASNKTLERMINEVDDMGELSLMDTVLRDDQTFRLPVSNLKQLKE